MFKINFVSNWLSNQFAIERDSLLLLWAIIIFLYIWFNNYLIQDVQLFIVVFINMCDIIIRNKRQCESLSSLFNSENI